MASTPPTARRTCAFPDTQLNDWADLDTARPALRPRVHVSRVPAPRNAGGEDLVARASCQKGIDTPADFDTVLKQRGQLGVEEQWLQLRRRQ